MSTTSSEMTATIAVEVPAHVAEILRPLGPLTAMTHDIRGLLRDRLHDLGHDLKGIAEDAKDPVPHDLREIGAALTQMAAAFEAVAE
jgi:hypothetical protein